MLNKSEPEHFERAEKIFKKIQARLLSRHKGDIVAVEPDSGKYFIGKDETEVALRAINLMPGKLFGFFRVGYRAVHKVRSAWA